MREYCAGGGGKRVSLTPQQRRAVQRQTHHPQEEGVAKALQGWKYPEKLLSIKSFGAARNQRWLSDQESESDTAMEEARTEEAKRTERRHMATVCIADAMHGVYDARGAGIQCDGCL